MLHRAMLLIYVDGLVIYVVLDKFEAAINSGALIYLHDLSDSVVTIHPAMLLVPRCRSRYLCRFKHATGYLHLFEIILYTQKTPGVKSTVISSIRLLRVKFAVGITSNCRKSTNNSKFGLKENVTFTICQVSVTIVQLLQT
jgi:hypothetical protein